MASLHRSSSSHLSIKLVPALLRKLRLPVPIALALAYSLREWAVL